MATEAELDAEFAELEGILKGGPVSNALAKGTSGLQDSDEAEIAELEALQDQEKGSLRKLADAGFDLAEAGGGVVGQSIGKFIQESPNAQKVLEALNVGAQGATNLLIGGPLGLVSQEELIKGLTTGDFVSGKEIAERGGLSTEEFSKRFPKAFSETGQGILLKESGIADTSVAGLAGAIAEGAVDPVNILSLGAGGVAVKSLKEGVKAAAKGGKSLTLAEKVMKASKLAAAKTAETVDKMTTPIRAGKLMRKLSQSQLKKSIAPMFIKARKFKPEDQLFNTAKKYDLFINPSHIPAKIKTKINELIPQQQKLLAAADETGELIDLNKKLGSILDDAEKAVKDNLMTRENFNALKNELFKPGSHAADARRAGTPALMTPSQASKFKSAIGDAMANRVRPVNAANNLDEFDKFMLKAERAMKESIEEISDRSKLTKADKIKLKQINSDLSDLEVLSKPAQTMADTFDDVGVTSTRQQFGIGTLQKIPVVKNVIPGENTVGRVVGRSTNVPTSTPLREALTDIGVRRGTIETFRDDERNR